MRVIIKPDYEALSQWVAEYIAAKIKDARPTIEKPFVLGLPTGSSPLGTYQELINHYKTGTISFQHVITFNMDEYVGIPKNHPQSYHSFMWNHFFSHIDIPSENVNINKQKHIISAAKYFLKENWKLYAESQPRFDVIEVYHDRKTGKNYVRNIEGAFITNGANN